MRKCGKFINLELHHNFCNFNQFVSSITISDRRWPATLLYVVYCFHNADEESLIYSTSCNTMHFVSYLHLDIGIICAFIMFGYAQEPSFRLLVFTCNPDYKIDLIQQLLHNPLIKKSIFMYCWQ